MSRQIDLTKPLSDEDREFLEERGQYVDLHMNAAHLAAAEVEQAKTEEPVSDTGSDAEPKLPNKSASKPEWVAYAVAKGVPADEAEAQTRDELIARFTA